ncbi:MAG: F0F1 ATP synthase subunit B [Paracoccaceae bacterium]|nr:MAG: F0F1 ATP synthase subunit B [Paracoccaceae bacterium]
MIRLSLALGLTATPALAATGPFFSLGNTDFIVLISFLIFVGVLVYAGVPGIITNLLDKRAAQISAELDEAAALRDEAKAILASYERKKKDVQEQADRIVAAAKDEATRAAEEAKEELKRSIARRLAAAEDRIAAAETAAVREVRERAVTVAVAAAGSILAQQSTPKTAAAAIDAAIEQVGARLH